MAISYPFIPKTNRHLQEGQFWAIPLKTGQYACGRVIQVTKSYMASPSKTFLAGLMDWLGEHPPTESDLAGSQTIAQGVAHVKAIQETGLNGSVTGIRPLELDNVEPNFFRSQTGYDPEHCKLMRGMIELRPITKAEWERYDTLGIWGYDVIRVIAEARLLH